LVLSESQGEIGISSGSFSTSARFIQLSAHNFDLSVCRSPLQRRKGYSTESDRWAEKRRCPRQAHLSTQLAYRLILQGIFRECH
jgi:hypothetical protein